MRETFSNLANTIMLDSPVSCLAQASFISGFPFAEIEQLKVHDLLIIFTYILPITFTYYLTFLSDYLSCSLLIIYHTYLTLTYCSDWFSCTVIQYKYNYHAAC